MRSKRKMILALILALSLALGGCSFLPETLEDSWADVVVPLPPIAETAGEAPVGDVTESEITRVTLYYPSADGTMLTPVTRLFWMNGDMAAEERVADEMMKPPVGTDIVSAVPADARLAWMEKSMGVLTINLKTETEPADDAGKTAMTAALTATFTEMSGIEHVNLLINGRAVALGGLPAGTMDKVSEQPGRLRQHYLEEAARLRAESDPEKPERLMTVYCPTLSGGLVVPEVRRVTLEDETGLSAALAELCKAPQGKSLTAGVPLAAQVLAGDPEITEENGRRVANVRFTAAVYHALEESPVTRWQFLSATVLTITTFCPEIDGVRVYFEDYMVKEAPNEENVIVQFADGMERRGDFAARIGAVARIYCADAEGRLCAEERGIGRADAASARALIALLTERPRAEGLLKPTLPAGLTAADVLGVAVRDGVAEINLSANFYRLCQTLDAREERLAVYSLVNTITDNGLARAVRFYIEGKTVDTLAGTVSLRGPLMPLTERRAGAQQ